jgi:hypothetical protein
LGTNPEGLKLFETLILRAKSLGDRHVNLRIWLKPLEYAVGPESKTISPVDDRVSIHLRAADTSVTARHRGAGRDFLDRAGAIPVVEKLVLNLFRRPGKTIVRA